MVTSFFKRYRIAVAISTVLILFYLLTRITTLTNLPIFTDEAIYLRWAQIAGNDVEWRFISLTDGKQPLFIWITAVFMRFIDDPLTAGRMVSVMSGLLSAVGLFFLGKEVFRNYRVGLLAAGLYCIYPFAFVYDRMALYDSLVGAFAVWGLYLAVLFTRTLRLDVALILGGVVGASVLNKSNGFFTVLLLPFAMPLLPFKKKKLPVLVRWMGLSLLVAVLAYGIYSLLRLSQFFYIIDQKNTTFIYPFSEWIQNPLRSTGENLEFLTKWFYNYMTFPWIAAAIGVFVVNKKYLREKGVLVLWCVLPFIVLVFFGKVIYPRYIFPMTLSLLPLVAYCVVALWERFGKKLGVLSLFVISLFPLWADYKIATDFVNAPIADSDIGQYIHDWPAGGGVKESVAFFKEQAQRGPVYIGTEGTFGLLPFAYDIEFTKDKHIKIEGYWPIDEKIPEKILAMASQMPTFVVFYQPCVPCKREGEAPEAWPVTQVMQITRPGGVSRLTVYQVTPQ